MEYINQLEKFENKQIHLKGWVANKRESKGLVFLLLRDGKGFVQCVFDEKILDASSFELAQKLTLECSLGIKGTVI